MPSGSLGPNVSLWKPWEVEIFNGAMSELLMQTVKACQFSNNWGLWLIIYIIEG